MSDFLSRLFAYWRGHRRIRQRVTVLIVEDRTWRR
jgi:hypothetical protein